MPRWRSISTISDSGTPNSPAIAVTPLGDNAPSSMGWTLAFSRRKLKNSFLRCSLVTVLTSDEDLST